MTKPMRCPSCDTLICCEKAEKVIKAARRVADRLGSSHLGSVGNEVAALAKALQQFDGRES